MTPAEAALSEAELADLCWRRRLAVRGPSVQVRIWWRRRIGGTVTVGHGDWVPMAIAGWHIRKTQYAGQQKWLEFGNLG